MILYQHLQDIANRGFFEVNLVPGRPALAFGPASDFRHIALDVTFTQQEIDQLLQEAKKFSQNLNYLQIADGRNRWRLTPVETFEGRCVVLRKIAHAPSLEEYVEIHGRVQRMIGETETDCGVFFIIGPVGSGKSGLLSAITRYLLERDRLIYYVDEVIEFDFSQVRNRTGVAVRKAAKARDLATEEGEMELEIYRLAGIKDVLLAESRADSDLRACYNIARTGYRVWTTVHSHSTEEFLDRLKHLGHPAWTRLTRAIMNIRLYPMKNAPSRVVPVASCYYFRELSGLQEWQGDSMVEDLLMATREISVTFREALARAVQEDLIDTRYLPDAEFILAQQVGRRPVPDEAEAGEPTAPFVIRIRLPRTLRASVSTREVRLRLFVDPVEGEISVEPLSGSMEGVLWNLLNERLRVERTRGNLKAGYQEIVARFE